MKHQFKNLDMKTQRIMPVLATVLFASVLLLAGCEKDNGDAKAVPTKSNPFAGQWQWVSTEGGFSGKSSWTPMSEGYNVTLTLTGDSFVLYKDGQREVWGTYVLDTVSKNIFNKPLPRLNLKQINGEMGVPVVLYDGLILQDEIGLIRISDNMYDGLTSHFAKMI